MLNRKMNGEILRVVQEYNEKMRKNLEEDDFETASHLLMFAIRDAAVSAGVPPLYVERVLAASEILIDSLDPENGVIKAFIDITAQVMKKEYEILAKHFHNPIEFAQYSAISVHLGSTDDDGNPVEIALN